LRSTAEVGAAGGVAGAFDVFLDGEVDVGGAIFPFEFRRLYRGGVLPIVDTFDLVFFMTSKNQSANWKLQAIAIAAQR